MHHAHAQESGKTDKHGIDEIKIECTEEINQVTRCQPVACRTERRHQSRGNGNTRNHISFLFGRERRHTCQATHQGDEYVIMVGDVRASNSDCPRNGTHQKEMVAVVTLNKVVIKKLFKDRFINSNHSTHRKPHAHDRPHQRRDEHGTDNHGCGVYIQSQRGHEYGEYQNPKIGSFEFHSLTDGIYSFQFIVLVFTQIKIVFQKVLIAKVFLLSESMIFTI